MKTAEAIATRLVAPEQRVVLRNVDWETYARLSSDPDRRVPRMTFDRGELEIVSPSAEHERVIETLSDVVKIIAREWRRDFRSVVSTTFRRSDLKRGFEADASFYIAGASRMRGRTDIDLAFDPPPDLVIEVDISHPTFEKLAIFAAFGIAEAWRYVESRVSISVNDHGTWSEVEVSRVLDPVTATLLAQFVANDLSQSSVEWSDVVRQWARDNPPTREGDQ